MTERNRAVKQHHDWRLTVVKIALVLFAVVLMGRLFMLQVSGHSYYATLAENQHRASSILIPERGQILLHDKNDSNGSEKYYPAAVNKKFEHLAISAFDINGDTATAAKLAAVTGVPIADINRALEDKTRKYYIVKRNLSEPEVAAITEAKLKGVWLETEIRRYYPESALLSQVLGFVGKNDKGESKGMYGLERQFEELLAGKAGQVEAANNGQGGLVIGSSGSFSPAKPGSNLVLTIDHAIQVEVEAVLKRYVERFQAEQGTVIVADPKTGNILAMASAPDFNPNEYSKVEDGAVFSNPAVQGRYEPGSVMKPLAMAVALETDKLEPDDTFTDPGRESIAGHTILNSDFKTHGVQTMTQVLELSLNTGMVYVQRAVGNENLRKYYKSFGLDEKTGVSLPGEIKGDLRNMDGKDILAQATAAFGQGVSVTPVELVQAYAAIANKGVMPRLNIVSEIQHPDGAKEIVEPQMVRRVVSEKTAAEISSMLSSVVENGHGKRAGVAGYYIAGKTGTAQIPLVGKAGYDPHATIGNFIGYGPIENPTFVMLVKLDKPKGVQFAESTAAPAFGEIAKFILNYQQVPPTRPLK